MDKFTKKFKSMNYLLKLMLDSKSAVSKPTNNSVAAFSLVTEVDWYLLFHTACPSSMRRPKIPNRFEKSTLKPVHKANFCKNQSANLPVTDQAIYWSSCLTIGTHCTWPRSSLKHTFLKTSTSCFILFFWLCMDQTNSCWQILFPSYWVRLAVSLCSQSLC